MPSPRISIQAIIVIGFKKKKKRWSECFDFFSSSLVCHGVAQ